MFMKTNSKDKSLAKKVLLSVVAAGMMSGFVLSAEAADSTLEVSGDKVTKENVQIAKVVATGGAELTLKGGTVSGLKENRSDPDDHEDDGMIAADVAAEIVDKGTVLNATNVAFTGEVGAFEGSKIVINGGSVTAGNCYYDAAHGNRVEKLGTEISAHDSSEIELNKVAINSNLGAFDGGVITVNDSNVHAANAIYAEGKGSVINLNSSDGKAEYNVASEYGIEASDGATININGGATLKNISTENLPEGCEEWGLSFQANNGGIINIDSGRNKTTIIGGLGLQNAKLNVKGDVEFKNGNIEVINGSILKTEANSKFTAMYTEAHGKGSSIVANGSVDLLYVGATDDAEIILNGGRVDYTKEADDEKNLPGIWWDRAASADYANLTATDIDFIGDVRATTGGNIKLTGGSVTAGYVYEDGQIIKLTGFVAEYDGENKGYSVAEADGVKLNTNVVACHGGKVIVKNSTVNTTNDKKIYAYVKAEDENSTVEFYNTEITSDSILASGGAKLTVDEKSKAKVDNVVAINGAIEFNGNLTVNFIETKEKGNITFAGGESSVYNVTKSIVAMTNSKINIYGGTLKSDILKDLLIYSDAKGIVLDKNGIISTMSDQIYANKASETQKESGAITNEGIDFKGGKLVLNDAKYTLGYSQTAQAELEKQGATKLTMAGEMVEDSGETKTEITVDEASQAGSDVEFDKVTAKADKNLLVGSNDDAIIGQNIAGITVGDKVENGFAVGKLELGAGSDGVIITNDKEVTLGGSEGGSVLTVAGADKDVKVVVGTDADNIGNLNIGNSLATAATQYKLNGEVVVNEDSNLNINGQTEITKSLTLNDSMVNVSNGALKTQELNVTGDSILLGGVNAEKLVVGADGLLAVRDGDAAGSLTVDNVSLNGGMVFLDPVWQDGATISDASGLAVKNIAAADGAYVVGRNSVLSLGADLATAKAAFAKSEQTWGQNAVSAAAYIDSTLDVTNGSLTVDGSLSLENAPTTPPANGSVQLADKSLLMVNGSAINETTAALTGVSSADIAATSKLYIDNAEKNKTYKIIDGVAAGWAADNILSNNKLLNFTVNADNTVSTTSKSVKDAYGSAVFAANAYDAAVLAGGAAADFVAKATDEHVNAMEAAQVSALNSAAALSELAGVERGTYTASNLLTDAVAEHLSLTSEKEHDSDVWAKYIHSKENVDGLAIANFGAKYDAQYNGIVVGADLYKKGKATVGAALTYVDGNINGNTLAARTKNDATYYGASIYGSLQNGDSAVLGDISYLHGKNDITQYNSGANLTADAKTDAFSIGVRAEKSVKAGAGKFVPYAGLRYMHLGTGNYTNSIGMSYDGDDMNLWLLPVGVKYSADVKAGSWTLRPIAEVGYVWNLGDRDATQTVSLSGASNGFGYDVADSGSYIGRFAIEAEKANVTYGLGYEYQKGDSVKTNKWMANLNWNF